MPNRAGWCPGQQIEPFVVDLLDEVTPSSLFTIDYELEAYTNLLNTGYNNGSHTEPHYRIAGFLVEKSSERQYEDNINLRARSIELTTNGDPNNPVYESISMLIKNTSNGDVINSTAAYYVNGVLVLEEPINSTIY